MSDAKPYPRLFHCGSCGKTIGVENEDSKRIVSLWVLATSREPGVSLDEMQLELKDFRVTAMGHGGVVCGCGHVTQWYVNARLLKRLVTDRYETSRS